VIIQFEFCVIFPVWKNYKFLSFVKMFLPCCSRTSVANCSVVGPHFKIPTIDAVTRFIKDRSRSSSNPFSDCSFINPQPMRSKFYTGRFSDKMFYVLIRTNFWTTQQFDEVNLHTPEIDRIVTMDI
jgi:hypothetical protein